MKSLILTAAFASIAFATVAHADDDHRRLCGNVPVADWMSESDVRKRVSDMGIGVREVDIDDGCYEVEGRNKDGRWIEIGLQPQTGEQVWVDSDD
jgi:hypothetical protein